MQIVPQPYQSCPVSGMSKLCNQNDYGRLVIHSGLSESDKHKQLHQVRILFVGSNALHSDTHTKRRDILER